MDASTVEKEKVRNIDILRVMEMIPHRHPFLMIDKVTEVVANDSAVGIKNVTINEGFFQGPRVTVFVTGPGLEPVAAAAGLAVRNR